MVTARRVGWSIPARVAVYTLDQMPMPEDHMQRLCYGQTVAMLMSGGTPWEWRLLRTGSDRGRPTLLLEDARKRRDDIRGCSIRTGAGLWPCVEYTAITPYGVTHWKSDYDWKSSDYQRVLLSALPQHFVGRIPSYDLPRFVW